VGDVVRLFGEKDAAASVPGAPAGGDVKESSGGTTS
jgi:hypothetical protein